MNNAMNTLDITSPLIPNAGSSFRNYILVKQSATRYIFRATARAFLFPAIIMCFILYALVSIVPDLFASNMILIGILLLLGVSFALLLAIKLIIQTRKKYVFDSLVNAFWVDGIKSKRSSIDFSPEDHISLDKILSLQIIPKICTIGTAGNVRTYFCYELNISLSNGDIINILNHSQLKKIRIEAQELSSFLNSIPIIDNSKSL